MSEDAAELQAKIAALAGRINLRKQGSSVPNPSTHSSNYHVPQTPRWAPYGQSQPSYPRGGGFHRPSYPAHRNKTLVVNNSGSVTPNATDSPASTGSEGPGWVSKRDRGHMQLINTAVYDQKMQQKQLDMEDTAKEKQRLRNEREKTRVIKHVQGITATHAGVTTPTTPRDIVINDLRFRVAADGSKLMRVFGESLGTNNVTGQILNDADGSNKDAQTTPKQAKVAGVTFHRSKNGNLYRAGIVKKSLRYLGSPESYHDYKHQLTARCSRARTTRSAKLCPKFTSTGTQNSTQISHRSTNDRILKSVGRPLEHALTQLTGICPSGNRCEFTHDMNKIAICQQYLRHGHCAAGEECNLSHDPTPNRVPLCIHFIRGHCTNENCRYSHVKPDSSALVCRPFATMGYCEKGAECSDRHVMECPDYANTGTCRNANCRLPHVDTVANKRRAEAAKSNGRHNGVNDGDSDLSSDEEDHQAIDSDDVDSDDLDEDEVMTGSGPQSHELSQQQDFISFG